MELKNAVDSVTGAACPEKAAHEFLNAIAPTGQFTFQTFDDRPAKRPQLAKQFHGTLEQHAASLSELNEHGAGVFVVVNETDGNGRKAGNVTRIRALFADFDEPTADRVERLRELTPLPSAIIESSPGKHHAYWLLADGETLELAEFKPLQKSLAAKLESDPVVCDLPRVMRVPGFLHQKEKTFVSQIVEINGARYSAAQLRALGASPCPEKDKLPRALATACALIKTALPGTRNATLNKEAFAVARLVQAEKLEESQARAELLRAALEAGLGEDEASTTINSAFVAPQKNTRKGGSPMSDDGASLSKQIVDFVCKNCTLFTDCNGEVYAQILETRTYQHIRARPFRDWLSAKIYRELERVSSDGVLNESITTLSGIGRHDGQLIDVRVRTAGKSGSYWLDLAQPNCANVVCVDAGGWRIEAMPDGLAFVRPSSMQPLPMPVAGGNIQELWEFLNVPEHSRLLVLTWLVEFLRPETPYPVLEILGEQGCAKSTMQDLLRQIVDPNACNLRSAPRATEDIFISALGAGCVSFENISFLSPAQQDALCIVATGGGASRRKLYSDADESIITVKAPVMLNGIAVAVTAQDLVDRTITVELEIIKIRREINEIRADFENARPRILGALLTIASRALTILPEMKLPPDQRPRLVEFALLGMAVAIAAGYSPADFLAQFQAGRQEALARTLDASPVATAVMELIERRPQGITDTAKQILAALEQIAPNRGDAWPRTPKGLGDALRRAAPALRQVGIECRCLGKQSGSVKWSITPQNLHKACPQSPDVLKNYEEF